MSRAQFTGIHPQPTPTVAAASGGNLTASGTLWIAIQGRNRAGYSTASSMVSVNYVAGQRINVTIPSTARGNADDIHEWQVLACTSGVAADLVNVATVRGYGIDQITPTALPATVSLTRNAHLVLAGVVATAASLPTGSDLIRGMRRFVSAYSRHYVYDPDSTLQENSGTTATVLSAAAGRWIATGTFSTYLTDQSGTGGCDVDVRSILDPSSVLVPDYPVDGSDGIPIRMWWLHSEGNSPLSAGTRMGVAFYLNGQDKSQLFNGKFSLIFDGYADPVTGALDTAGMTTGVRLAYQARKTGLILEKDLPSGQAYQVQVLADFSTSDLLGQAIAGQIVQFFLFPYAQSGEYSEAWYLFGDFVYADRDRLLVVPDDVGCKMLSGGALIKRYSFVDNPETDIVGLSNGTGGQQVTIDGNGGVFVRIGTIPASERLRALVSTENGDSDAGAWSAAVAVALNDGIAITLNYPSNGTTATIRSDYPDAKLAGLVGKARLNVPTVKIYIENQTTGVIRRFAAALTDGATQIVTITDWTTGTVVSAVPSATTDDAVMFAPGAATLTIQGTGNFTAGNYRVRFAFSYDSGVRVSRIRHDEVLGCVATGAASFDLVQSRQAYWAEAVTTATALRAIPPALRWNYQSRYAVFVGNPVRFNPASTQADDGARYFRPDDIDAGNPGRWEVDDSNEVYLLNVAPATNLGEVGDVAYWSDNTTNTLKAYKKTGPTTWTLTSSLSPPAGAPGFGLRYVFDSGTGISPESGNLRLNNADPSLATQIFISETDRNSSSTATILSQITAGSVLQLIKESVVDVYRYYSVTSVTDNGTYRTIAITYLGGLGSLSDGDTVSLLPSVRGPQGTQGDQGIQGNPGNTGATGIPGFGIRYVFSNSTSSGPAAGQIRLSNAAPASVTQIFISETDRNSASIALILDQVLTGSVLQVADETTPAAYAYYSVTGITDNGGDRTIAVTYLAHGGSFTNAANTSLLFNLRGAQGTQGNQGNQGVTGLPGFGLRYTFSTDTASPPGSGGIEFDNAAPASVTQILLSESDRNSVSLSAILDQIVAGSVIQIGLESDPTIYAFYSINSFTDNGTHRTYAVTYQAHNGSFGNNSAVSLMFALRGATGATGATGAVSAASALVLEEQSSDLSTGTDEIKIYNLANALWARLESAGAILRFAFINLAQQWLRGQRSNVAALTDEAPVAIDANTSNMYTLTIATNRTLANPTNLGTGSNFVVRVTAGANTLTLDSAYVLMAGAAPRTGNFVLQCYCWDGAVVEVFCVAR